ncbi:MAG: thioredoxin domain-containing protein [Candidatus Angelobacter sp. Gp1-AA117]|nr:MAG: thioredoxin domain-containing protein [Candidatus Angelobacter sp. Gp1-AA117]
MSTEHLNSLSRASSSYLRSAMHQPIHWHEWGPEPFEKAQRENKPILLDIGAVWCHWCHVMDRESYENPEIAQIINENFIAIKVDRDERPDVDSRYQSGVQAISGQGGWPLTGFLTPEGKPYYGGTYFPPQDGYGRPSFKRVLLTLAQAYREKLADVQESADNVMTAISQAESFTGKSGSLQPHLIDRLVESAVKMFDAEHGGFGSAPKFPHPSAVDLLMQRHVETGDSQLLDIVTTTLKKMADGGVYDHLAGGFHRYSVDEHWVVPHFEKMSYDNSELLKNYVHAWQLTRDEKFAFVARDIIRWMNEWLTDQEHGGFYGSQDADYSLDDDGDYFTWTLDETKAVLSGEELEVATLHYDIGEVGDMHHNHQKNVLHVTNTPEEIAQRLNQRVEQVRAILDSARKKMYAARLQRPTPYVDKTIYVSWNALCISAYLAAAQALHLENARKFALRSLDRILSAGWHPQTGLQHVIAYSDPQAGKRQAPGVLDDYAFTIIACLDAYEATSDLTYFNFAHRIAGHMLANFADETSGGFFDIPQNSQTLGALTARRKALQDSPTPAGNPATAIALLRLYSYTNENKYRNLAEDTLEAFAGIAEHYGMFASTYAIALDMYLNAHTQIVIVGEGKEAQALVNSAAGQFSLNKGVLCLRSGEAVPQMLPPALAETIPNLPAIKQGKTVAVLCSGFSCQPPIDDPATLEKAIRLAVRAKTHLAADQESHHR